jgi:hypothetical protein
VKEQRNEQCNILRERGGDRTVGRCQELGYTGEYLNIVLSITLSFFSLYQYKVFYSIHKMYRYDKGCMHFLIQKLGSQPPFREKKTTKRTNQENDTTKRTNTHNSSVLSFFTASFVLWEHYERPYSRIYIYILIKE